MSYSTVLAQVNTLLSGVSGIANVYDRVRTEKEIKAQRDSFIDSGTNKFHTWFITRRSMPSQVFTTNQVERSHEFLLIGFYGVSDEDQSENTFQELCDTICDAFDTSAAVPLGNTADQLEPASLESFENGVTMASHLCHMAVIRIVASECVSP